MPTKTGAKKTAGKKGTTGAASGVISRKSLTVGVSRRSSINVINRSLQRALGQAGCATCLSGLERLVLDTRINVG